MDLDGIFSFLFWNLKGNKDRTVFIVTKMEIFSFVDNFFFFLLREDRCIWDIKDDILKSVFGQTWIYLQVQNVCVVLSSYRNALKCRKASCNGNQCYPKLRLPTLLKKISSFWCATKESKSFLERHENELCWQSCAFIVGRNFKSAVSTWRSSIAVTVSNWPYMTNHSSRVIVCCLWVREMMCERHRMCCERDVLPFAIFKSHL